MTLFQKKEECITATSAFNCCIPHHCLFNSASVSTAGARYKPTGFQVQLQAGVTPILLAQKFLRNLGHCLVKSWQKLSKLCLWLTSIFLSLCACRKGGTCRQGHQCSLVSYRIGPHRWVPMGCSDMEEGTGPRFLQLQSLSPLLIPLVYETCWNMMYLSSQLPCEIGWNWLKGLDAASLHTCVDTVRSKSLSLLGNQATNMLLIRVPLPSLTPQSKLFLKWVSLHCSPGREREHVQGVFG